MRRIKSITSEIPIFFSTDDNYIPFLDVAIRSLIANASKNFRYRIIVLNTGLSQESIDTVKENEAAGFSIDFVDISREVEKIRSSFKHVYHFTVAAYYRLFIASLFPQYKKIVYLDCDLVVTGDISKLYNTDLGDNIIAAAPEQFVQSTPEFRAYAKYALGVDPDGYVNSGVLVIDLEKFRQNQIKEQFVHLITKHNFDLIDPDQAYINYLCRGRIYTLANGWNKTPLPTECEGEKNIVHYALYKKPWQYDDVIDGEYFWEYAKASPFYNEILCRRRAFGDRERAAKEAASREIVEHATRIIESGYTFAKKLEKIAI